MPFVVVVVDVDVGVVVVAVVFSFHLFINKIPLQNSQSRAFIIIHKAHVQ